MTGTPSPAAATFTAGGAGSCPRPAGRSGWLTTAANVVPAATARSDGTANAGEPKNSARGALIDEPRCAPSRQVVLIAGAQPCVAEHARRLAGDLADGVQLRTQLGGQHRIDRLGRGLERQPIVRALDLVRGRLARQAEDL